MFVKSIRFKIMALYMVMLSVTLLSFSIMLYHNVNVGLYGGMDTLLESRAGGIAKAIDTYWEASNLEAADGGEKSEVLRKRRNANFSRIAQRWVREESSDPALLNIIVQVFDTDGAAIASSKNTQGIASITRSNFISVLQGKARFDTVSFEAQAGQALLRVYTTPIFENEKVAYIVQISSPVSTIQIALNKLKLALFFLLPFTVFLTGIMGALLAKATLRPVDSMIATIHQITAANMKLRLAVPPTKDEIQKLAQTFNDMLQRLEEAFVSQRRLFEDISHELKTPLTVMKGEFEVMLKKLRTQEEYETAMVSALEEVNRITKLAEQLLMLARFDSKQSFPEKKLLNLSKLMEVIIVSVRRLAGQKQIRLSFMKTHDDLFMEGDESQLKTMLLNILDNAVKYTPAEGEIRVTIERDTMLAKVKIQDTGIGILQKDIERIFDRFYRVEKSRSAAGYGLGLSIAKAIAESHKGSIEVKSKPASGTLFTITLPLSQIQLSRG